MQIITPSVRVKSLRLSVTVHCNLTWQNRFYEWIYIPARTTLWWTVVEESKDFSWKEGVSPTIEKNWATVVWNWPPPLNLCFYTGKSLFFAHEICLNSTGYMVISEGHAVKVLKAPKPSQTKVFDKKIENFWRPGVGPVKTPQFLAVSAGELWFWLPAPKLSNLAPLTHWPFFISTLRAKIWYKFEVCSSTRLGDMGQNVCFGVARTTSRGTKKGRSAKTGLKIKKKFYHNPTLN